MTAGDYRWIWNHEQRKGSWKPTGWWLACSLDPLDPPSLGLTLTTWSESTFEDPWVIRMHFKLCEVLLQNILLALNLGWTSESSTEVFWFFFFFLSVWCWAPPLEILNKLVWEVAWTLGFFKSPQIILMCTQVWETVETVKQCFSVESMALTDIHHYI